MISLVIFAPHYLLVIGAQDVTDVSFFAKAMEVCNYHSNDLVSAKRLDQLLNQPSNQSLLGGSSNQFIY